MPNPETEKTVIAEDVEIVGSIKCASNVRLAGKLNGDLVCNGNAIIAETAIVKGNLNVDSVTVLGQVNGNITARDRIELKASAKITGDIKSKRLTVEDGVTFVGKSEVNPSGTRVSGPTEGKPAGADSIPFEPEEAHRREEPDKGKGGGLFGRK